MPPRMPLSNSTINVLVANPNESDYRTLQQMLSPHKWVLVQEKTVQAAQRQLRTGGNGFALVVCDHELMPGTWRDLLADLLPIVQAPLLIVSSRLGDDRFWAEALNLGAYDVLVKPFDQDEVRRVLTSAWARWARKHRVPTPSAEQTATCEHAYI